jgi:hypothetical protein
VNSQTVVRKEEKTPGITSDAPRCEAGADPTRMRHLAMLSALTILSSMINPTAINMAISETMLIVPPIKDRIKNVARKDTGRAAEIQNASRIEK